MDGSFVDVEPAERDGTEVYGPDARGDLLEPDVLAAEQVADVDPGRVPPDPTVRGDLSDLEMGRVLGRAQLGRHGPGRGLVHRSRGLVIQRFVGPHLVEVGPELVEPTLLGGPVPGGWDRGVALQRAVHPFVASVLLRGGRLDQVGQDAELDPPDAELGEPA
jgi:hypothetical protein